MRAFSRRFHIKPLIASFLALSCVSNTTQADDLSLAWDWQLSAEALNRESRHLVLSHLITVSHSMVCWILKLDMAIGLACLP